MTRERRPRSSCATAAVVLTALAAGGAFLAVVGACLPELDAVSPADPAGTGTATTPRIGQFCGDGVIQLLDDGGDAGESCDPGDGGEADEGGRSGCSGCKVVCAGQLSTASNHCYFFVDRTARIHDANELCADAGGHVVTIAGPREASFVYALVGDAGSFWIGLENSNFANGFVTKPPPPEPQEPGYPKDPSDTCRGCFGGDPDGGDGGPLLPLDDAGGDQSCVVASAGLSGFRWYTSQCGDIRDGGFLTLCEREPPGQRSYLCGGPFCTTVPVTFGQKRYVVGLTPVSADQAVQACASYPGGRLVTLDSAEEREELARELQILLGQPGSGGPAITVWIGYHRDGSGGWLWDDGDDGGAGPDGGFRPPPWGSHEPAAVSGSRAYLRFSDGYDTELAASDDDPQAARYFVCERPLEADGG